MQSGKLGQPTFLKIMTIENTYNYLSTLLGYPLHVPDAPATYSHRLGVLESWCRRKEEEKKESARQAKPKKDPNELTAAQKRILMIINCNKGLTAADVAKKTGWCNNHCSLSMTDLWRKKLVNREMHRGGQARWYGYTKKEQT